MYVNPAFERITGFTAEEAVGRTPVILAAERQGREVHRDLWQTILQGQVWRGEITNRRKDGTCGYTVLEASNGGEALLFCERYSGPIHALVTDVVMPHMDGYEVAERLRTIRPGMRMLFVSGYTEHVAGRQGRARAGDAFLAKPFTPDALARKVREVLAYTAAA